MTLKWFFLTLYQSVLKILPEASEGDNTGFTGMAESACEKDDEGGDDAASNISNLFDDTVKPFDLEEPASPFEHPVQSQHQNCMSSPFPFPKLYLKH